jgi:hypothetical protein
MNLIETLRPPAYADVGFLFCDYTDKPVLVRFHPKVYPIERDAEANWVWHAFRGMERLKKTLEAEGRAPRSFAAVGTGSGVDAIGAGFIFPTLETIAVTDIEPGVLAQGLENVRANVRAGVSVIGQAGDLCCPLHALRQRFDLIYANLPNLPVPAKKNGAIDFNTCYAERDETLDPKLAAYLLGFQYMFLKSARAVLDEKGSALLMIGGRFPYEMFARLAELSGYVFEELLCCLRLETDLATTIDAYAAHEGEIEFDYYLFDESTRALEGKGELAGDALKAALAPYRLSAREAGIVGAKGKRIGHTLHMIRAMPAS